MIFMAILMQDIDIFANKKLLEVIFNICQLSIAFLYATNL